MVNSKKMSKSSIAVIVLAILLVLSMVLGLTGAWYTAKAESAGNAGDSLTIRDGWLELSVTGAAGAGVSSSGDLDNAMPGDTITVADATFGFKATRVGAYTGDVVAHVFLVKASDNSKVEYQSVTIAEGENEKVITFANLDNELDLTDANSILVDNGDGTYTVNTNLTYADAGKTASFALGAYKVVAVQDENVADEGAAWTIAQTQLA